MSRVKVTLLSIRSHHPERSKNFLVALGMTVAGHLLRYASAVATARATDAMAAFCWSALTVAPVR